MTGRDGFLLVDGLSGIDAAEWDALARDDGVVAPALSHAFLHTLEDTGCVGRGTGWTPRHATLWCDGRLAAAMPLYEKQHSYGEYVFDWAWAEAYARHGLPYYPKWLAAVPFTPLPGRRLLGRDTEARRALLHAVLEHVRDSRHSSFHLLLPTDEEAGWLRDAGLLIRQGVQFHWTNTGYRDFDDFLVGLNHEKRKKIRQERRRSAAHGLDLCWLDGHTASSDDWAFFFRCYATTYALHRSTPYLNARFFSGLARRQPETVRLLIAARAGQPVASAFFLCDRRTLYGRYWGAIEHLPFLHFELCYYQAIEYCIRHGLAIFEGGAQGEHKLARGLLPVTTRSAHWIADPRFRHAVNDYLARETAGVELYLDELTERTPFRLQPPSR
ncbi:GNAT family N-acetyltransferase [Thauera sinica]|uniref:GNAT family N-acetyltransferase n=1 Tax=Thauera sinica TaxID=2665146 RepID=A0ABW1AW43_9RHOO|nr:GNAT family N-acetyltransferase [Thauera sp. K11]ATE60276.1 GNAT family N-acetyltransferase [Thauera sp. K11]